MAAQVGALSQLSPRSASTPLKISASVQTSPSVRSWQSKRPSPSLSAPATQAAHVPPQPSLPPAEAPQFGTQQSSPQRSPGSPHSSLPKVAHLPGVQHTPEPG